MKVRRLLTVAVIGGCLLLFVVLNNCWSTDSTSCLYLSGIYNSILKNQHTRPKGNTMYLQTGNRMKPGTNMSLEGYYVTMKDLPPPERGLNNKYIIYRCVSGCGGLGDRENGIVTAYVLSQMLRRKFGIIMQNQCDFSNYVVPNIVDWMVDEESLKGKTFVNLDLVDHHEFGLKMKDGDLEVMFEKQVTYYNGNNDFVSYLTQKPSYQGLSWTKNRAKHEVFRIAIAHLFRLAPQTELKYADFMSRLSSEKLVCAHLRIGQSDTFPLDGPRPLKPNITVVTQFLKEKIDNSSRLFISTDSNEVREEMGRNFPKHFVEMEGKIVHIDRPGWRFLGLTFGKLDCGAMEKAILDQFILSKCNILVISESNFSWLAAIIRGSVDQVFLAWKRNISKLLSLEGKKYFAWKTASIDYMVLDHIR